MTLRGVDVGVERSECPKTDRYRLPGKEIGKTDVAEIRGRHLKRSKMSLGR